jgi:hypothetical protein
MTTHRIPSTDSGWLSCQNVSPAVTLAPRIAKVERGAVLGDPTRRGSKRAGCSKNKVKAVVQTSVALVRQTDEGTMAGSVGKMGVGLFRGGKSG